MNTFESFYNSIINEKTEGFGNLYHTTNLFNLYHIVKQQNLKLTYSSAIGSEDMKYKKHPFFLSTSRVKFGNYAQGGDFKSEYFSNVTINIDIHKLKKYGITFKEWDYWGDEFKKIPTFKEEQEVRIFYKEDKLPINKVVDEIHVFIKKGKKNTVQGKNALLFINSQANVPTYFYHDPLAYKTQNTNKAIPDVESALNEIETEKPYEGDSPNFRSTKKDADKGDFLIKTLLKIYKGNFNKDRQEPPVSKYTTEDRIFETLWSDYNGGVSSIMTDFHNVFRQHPPTFKQWHREMMKAGANNTLEFVKIIQKYMNEHYDVYGNKLT
jgi:hypothetical protein